jgi:hypothetical protein
MSMTPNSAPAILEYDPDLFVNREPEIELVKDKARALSLGEMLRKRTIVFWGYKGTGRTWLLRKLEDELPGSPGVRALYLNLDTWSGHNQAEQAVQEIAVCLAQWVGEQLDSPTAVADEEQVPHDILCQRLQADVQRLLSRYVAVLLLDHVYESDWILLKLLEEHILASAAVERRLLTVMAGRGQAYPWKTPELRLYVRDHHLEPFDQTLTQAQLERQKAEAVPRASDIHEMSRGYPLGNYFLADRPTPAEALQRTVDGLLEGVPQEQRTWLEALCILRSFDEEHIPPLLAAYFEDDSFASWSYKESRQARDRLLLTRMVRWKEKAGGWEVDGAIRPLLEEYLQHAKPEIWRRLHNAAHKLYLEWKGLYPDETYLWQQQADYHAQRLRNAGYAPDQGS